MARQKRNEWFENIFLASQKERMNNPKYPNQCILSPKQEYICEKYMVSNWHLSDYGGFYTYEYKTDDEKYLMYFRGKYTFLCVSQYLHN